MLQRLLTTWTVFIVIISSHGRRTTSLTCCCYICGHRFLWRCERSQASVSTVLFSKLTGRSDGVIVMAWEKGWGAWASSDGWAAKDCHTLRYRLYPGFHREVLSGMRNPCLSSACLQRQPLYTVTLPVRSILHQVSTIKHYKQIKSYSFTTIAFMDK